MPRGEDRSVSGPSTPLSAVDLARVAADVLGASPLPALVLEVASGRIVAAGLRASQLLDPTGTPVVGRLLEDYTADQPVVGPDLLAGGRVNGYETFRVLRRARGAGLKVRMWVRTFDHQPPSQLVLVVLLADRAPVEAATLEADLPEAPAVVGTAGADMVIEQISPDAEDLLGMHVDEIVGRSVTELIVEADRPFWVAAVNTDATAQSGVTLTVDIEVRGEGGHRQTLRCEMLLLPVRPQQGWVFIVMPTHTGDEPAHPADSLSAILTRLGRGAEIAHLARGMLSGTTDRDVPGLAKLSTRELEIVGRLLEGDRAPAIASRLFLTQSTVRNHLAAVFAKLGVNSQQELLNLFRRIRPDKQNEDAS